MVMERRCVIDGAEWRVWPSGGGAYGTGPCGLGNVEAVHFATADAPDVPVYEALIAAGRFDCLFDDEIVDVFRKARRVVDATQLAERQATRRVRGNSDNLHEKPLEG